METGWRTGDSNGYFTGLFELGKRSRPDLRRFADRATVYESNQALPSRTPALDRLSDTLHRSGLVRFHASTTRSGTPRVAARGQQRYGTALTEGLLMSSRDGVKFHRWNEAFWARDRAAGCLALRPTIHRLAHRRNEIPTRRGSQRAVVVCIGGLLARRWQCATQIHAAAGWICVGDGTMERWSTVDATLDLRRPAT